MITITVVRDIAHFSGRALGIFLRDNHIQLLFRFKKNTWVGCVGSNSSSRTSPSLQMIGNFSMDKNFSFLLITIFPSALKSLNFWMISLLFSFLLDGSSRSISSSAPVGTWHSMTLPGRLGKLSESILVLAKLSECFLMAVWVT